MVKKETVSALLDIVKKLNAQAENLANEGFNYVAASLTQGAGQIASLGTQAVEVKSEPDIIDNAKKAIAKYYAKYKEFYEVSYSSMDITGKNNQLLELSGQLQELKSAVTMIKKNVNENNVARQEITTFEEEQKEELENKRQKLIKQKEDEEKKEIEDEKKQQEADEAFINEIEVKFKQKTQPGSQINNRIEQPEVNNKQSISTTLTPEELKLDIKQKGEAIRKERLKRISKAAKDLIGGDLYKAAKTISDSSKRNELRAEQIKSINELGDEYYLTKLKKTVTSPFKTGKNPRAK